MAEFTVKTTIAYNGVERVIDTNVADGTVSPTDLAAYLSQKHSGRVAAGVEEVLKEAAHNASEAGA